MIPFSSIIDEHTNVIKQLRQNTVHIEHAAEMILSCMESEGKLLLCGNGGSAADSQHIAAEFVVRYENERMALPAISLTTDTSILTAHTNDFSFTTVFSRQIEALGSKGDCLIAISTSGNSKNIIEAVITARKKGLFTIGMTGEDGGLLSRNVDIAIKVPSNVTARIQEAHILIAHWWCQFIDWHVTKKVI